MSKVPMRVVIESPLSGDFKRNKRYALWCGYHCYTLGESAYASHLVFPQFLDDKNPEHREFGITAGYEWAQMAHMIFFYMDLGESSGMTRARELWDGMNMATDDRELPPEMWAAFNRGETPGATPGFAA